MQLSYGRVTELSILGNSVGMAGDGSRKTGVRSQERKTCRVGTGSIVPTKRGKKDTCNFLFGILLRKSRCSSDHSGCAGDPFAVGTKILARQIAGSLDKRFNLMLEHHGDKTCAASLAPYKFNLVDDGSAHKQEAHIALVLQLQGAGWADVDACAASDAVRKPMNVVFEDQ